MGALSRRLARLKEEWKKEVRTVLIPPRRNEDSFLLSVLQSARIWSDFHAMRANHEEEAALSGVFHTSWKTIS